MSLNEEIARLTGLLVFKTDSTGLQRFMGLLKSAEVAMEKVGKQADALSARMNKSLGLRVDTAAQAKLDKQLRSSLDRELRGEVLLQKAKRATFQAELQGQKLQFAGQKELAFLSTAAIRDKQALAVLEAKTQAAQAAKLKVQGLAIKNEDALAQAKARQVRAESILATQQARTVALQAQQQRTMSATQRIEQAMLEGRARGQRAAIRFAETQAAQKVRAQRQDVAFQQRAERHAAFQQRQVQWEANRNKPVPSTGFLGLGTGALAVGGAAAGVAAIVGAISALGARMEAVQGRVSESQQLENVLTQAGGKNPANAEFAKTEWLRINAKYGTEASLESAKAYRTFLMAEVARGRSLSQATGTYETRQAAFRGAGMTAEEQRRANLQLQQIASKSQSDREDLNTFSEAAPLLVEPIRRAWAARNKHALDGNLEKDFRASTTAGNLKAEDFTKGIELFVKENADAIARQSASIDANATRLSNAQFLQQQGLDQNPELIGAINERLKSEMDLNEAMKPLKETAVQLDIALNKLVTSALRMAVGKTADGEAMTPEERARQIGNAGVDGVLTLPGGSSDTLTTQQRLDADTRDPISKLWRLLGVGKDLQKVADDNRERWGGVGFSDHAPWDIRPEPLDLSSLNTGGLPNYGKRLEDLLSQSDPNAAVAKFATAAAANASRATSGSRGEWVSDERAVKSEPVTNNVTNNTPITVEVNITTKTDASAAEIGATVSGQVREEIQKVFQSYQPKEVH
ncbi:tape measure protein [Pseudomonas sp. MPB23]|uniref:tape measure protein n=1 Tax=Pseudomonas sp. MPB23 TaxID=3388490 RepID=UPI0039846EFE